jgi:hypothetical protein
VRSCIDARAAALMEEEPATPTHARRSCMYEAVLEQAARLGMYSVDPSALMSDLSMSLALNFLRDKQTEDGILERTAEMQREEGSGRLGAEVNGKAGTEGMGTEGNGTVRVEANGSVCTEANGSIHTEANGSLRTEANGKPGAANGTLRTGVDEEALIAPEDGARPAAQMARNNSRGALRMSPQVRHDILELPAGFSGAPAEGGHSGMAAADKGETVALEKGGMVAVKKVEETGTSGQQKREPLVGDTVLAGSGRREPESSGTELSGTELSGRKEGELPERGSPSNSPGESIKRTFRGQASNGGIRFQVVRNEFDHSGVVKAVEVEQVKTEPVRAVQAERVKEATEKSFLEHAGSQTETEWAAHSGTSGSEASITWKSPKVTKPEGSEKVSTFGETSSREGSPVRMDGSFVASIGSNGSPPANDLDVKVKSREEYSPKIASVQSSSVGTDPIIQRKDVTPTEQTSPGGTREATSKGSPTSGDSPRRSSSGHPQERPAESVRFSTAAGFLRKKTPRTDSSPKGDPSPLGGSPRGSVSSRSSPLAGISLNASPRDPDSPNRTSSYLAGTRGIQQLRELRKTQEKVVTAVRPSAAPLKVIPRRNSEPQLSRLSIPGHLGLDMMDSPGVKPSNPADAKAPKTSTGEIGAQKSSPHASNNGQVTPPNGKKQESPSEVTQGSPAKGRPQVKPLNLRALAEESPGSSNQSTPLSGDKSRKSTVADSYMDNLLERERLKGSKEAGRKPSPRLSPLPVSFPRSSFHYFYSFVPRNPYLFHLSRFDSYGFFWATHFHSSFLPDSPFFFEELSCVR